MQGPTAKTKEQPGDSVKRTLVAQLPDGGTDAPDPALASATTWKPLSRPPMRLIVARWAAGAVALAVLAVLGFQVYKMFSTFDLPFEKVPLSTAVSGGATERRGPSATDTIGRDVAAGDASVAKVDKGGAPFAAPASPSKAVPRDAVLKPTEPPSVSRRAAAARAASEREMPRAAPCTEAVAALGLCTMKPGHKKEATDTGKAGQREPPRQEACTEAVAALGLCTPTSTQRRE
jgi:hypothetical protein